MSTPPAAPSERNWIPLEGAANARDLGGLPVGPHGVLRHHRLLRSGNLQTLSARDVRTLVDGYDLRAVADLRTDLEVEAEGAGPLTREPDVRIEHLSLLPDFVRTTQVPTADDGRALLPWQDEANERSHSSAQDTYRRYLAERPDSILAALRLIAGTDGATLINCAAGKDRTGVVVALALLEIGVDRETVIADYVASGERIDDILRGLAASPTYTRGIDVDNPDRHRPRERTMRAFLDALDAEGGAPAWLRANGWTQDDADALRANLADTSTQ